MRPTTSDGWAAVLAWYSLIHLAASELPDAIGALTRPLAPGGWLVLAMHAGSEVRHNDEWFDIPIDLDFVFNEPDDVVALVKDAGLVDIEWYRRGPHRAPGRDHEPAVRRGAQARRGVTQSTPGGAKNSRAMPSGSRNETPEP